MFGKVTAGVTFCIFRVTLRSGIPTGRARLFILDAGEFLPTGGLVARYTKLRQWLGLASIKTARVERAFRTLKGLDLRIRPVHHRNEDRVRAHIFLCLLAYYVEWHMRQALAPLLFDDELLPQLRNQRDPVAPAKPSKAAQQKKSQRKTEQGWPIHSFSTLIAQLATRCRHRCRLKADPDTPAIEQGTERTSLQARAFELIRLFPVPGN